MNPKKLLFIVFFLSSIDCAFGAKQVFDKKGMDMSDFFKKKDVTYVIRYNHSFKDTISVPPRCIIKFENGSLKGPIVFKNTKLAGNVNLIGSSVSGKVINDIFDASWICHKDGMKDDAHSINEILGICDRIFFPAGKYRLISKYDPTGRVHKSIQKSIKCHIGIYRSNIELLGEAGTVFITDKAVGTICVFSKPNNIRESVKNITIKNIEFIVNNDGNRFHEFLHTIKTIGVDGLTIEKCKFYDFWGDAICLSHFGDNPQTGERTRNRNVFLLGNAIIGGKHHNNRNGISIISGQNIVVKGNTIKNTSREDMPGGIVVEPNNSAYTIDNITIEGNDIEGVRGRAGAIDIVIFRGASGHSITIQSNRIKNCTIGISICVETKNTSDNFVIRNNYIDPNTPPFRFLGKGRSKRWTISENTFGRRNIQRIPGKIRVDNIAVSNNSYN